MELKKKNIHFNRIAKEARNQITLEEDVNIPDIKEDIESVLFTDCRVILEEVRAGEQKVHIRGKIVYTILYRSEETGRLCSLEGSIPIDEQLYMDGVNSSNKVMAKTQVEDFSVGIINSRKLSIRSILELYAYLQDLYDEEITTGISGLNCEIRQKECDFTQLAVCKKDIVRFREMVNLPGNMPNVEQIILSCMKVQDLEYKPMDGQLSVHGKVQMLVIYDGERDSRNQVFRTMMPFSTVVECSGLNMNMIYQIAHEILDSQVHLESDYDGEPRSFSVEMVLELDMKMYEPQKVGVLWDVYGIDKELVPKVSVMEYDVLEDKLSGSIMAKERAPMPENPESMPRILYSDGRCFLEKCEIKEQGIMLSGIVICQMLFENESAEDTAYESMQSIIPFNKKVEFPSDMQFDPADYTCSVNVDCSDIQLAYDMEKAADVTVNVDYEILLFKKMQGHNVTDVDVKEMDADKYDKLPSMAVYFAKPGDTLWDMGKKYCVPIKKIQELNNLPSDELRAGEKILIVRGSA